MIEKKFPKTKDVVQEAFVSEYLLALVISKPSTWCLGPSHGLHQPL